MARRSLPTKLKSSNRAVRRPRKITSTSTSKKILRMGSKEFNKMFPQLGKLMGGVYQNESGQDLDLNPVIPSIQVYNDTFIQILENQNKQNDILNQILQQLRGSNLNIFDNQTNGFDFTDIDLPDSTDLERRRPRAKPRSRWGRFVRYLQRRSPRLFGSIGVKLLRNAGLALLPVAGWIGLALTIGSTASDMIELYNIWNEFQSSEEENITGNQNQPSTPEPPQLTEEPTRELPPPETPQLTEQNDSNGTTDWNLLPETSEVTEEPTWIERPPPPEPPIQNNRRPEPVARRVRPERRPRRTNRDANRIPPDPNEPAIPVMEMNVIYNRQTGETTTVITPPPESQNKSIENNNLDAVPTNTNSINNITLSSKEFKKINFEARLIKFESGNDIQSKSADFDATRVGDNTGIGFTNLENITGDGRAINGSAARALEFFQSKGWTLAQAAGIVANLDIETAGTFDSATVGDNGQAYGIAQWHPDRQRNFENWSGRNIRGSTFEQQLEFVNYELREGNERRAGNLLRQINTPEEAAASVDQFYERSNGAARQQRISRAITLAGNTSQATPVRNESESETNLSQNSSETSPNENIGSTSTRTERPPSTGSTLSQAGTDMIAADQRQALTSQEMNNTVSPIHQYIKKSKVSQLNSKEQMIITEIPLRIRLESAFGLRS